MRRGTTPTYVLVADADLEGFDIVVSFRRGDYRTDLRGDRLSVEAAQDEQGATHTDVSFTLTQQETLRLGSRDPRKRDLCQVQLRAVDRYGTAVASEIAEIEVLPVLRDGVIAYED